MTALVSYSTGTVSVAAGGTIVTGAGVIWTDADARPGDILQIGNFQSVISDKTDTTHLVIPPWGGGAQAGVAYKVWQVSPQRFAGSESLATVNKLVAAFNTSGFFVFVDVDLTEPDPSLGDDGQYAFQPTTGKTWAKVAGVWSYLGVYKAFNLRGAYDNAATYSYGDVQTTSGASYIYINETPSAGHAAPNPTYWQVLAAKGDTGATGSTGAAGTNGTNGAGYGGTSTTSRTIGTGSQAFATQAGLAYQNGARVRATSNGDVTKWMEGVATYSGATLTITVDNTSGSGTFADWNFNIAGATGTAVGAALTANNLSDLLDKAVAVRNVSPTDLYNGTTRIASYTDLSRNYFGREYLGAYLNSWRFGGGQTANVLMRGDSTMVGNSLSSAPQTAPDVVLKAVALRKGLRIAPTNLGVGGTTIADWKNTHLPSDLSTYTGGNIPKLYILNYGMNDPYTGGGSPVSVAQSITNLRAGFALLRATWTGNQTSVVYVMPNTAYDDTGARSEVWRELFAAGAKEACRDYGVMFVDVYAQFREARFNLLTGWLNATDKVHPADDFSVAIWSFVADAIFQSDFIQVSCRPLAVSPASGFTLPGSLEDMSTTVSGDAVIATGYMLQTSPAAISNGATLATIHAYHAPLIQSWGVQILGYSGTWQFAHGIITAAGVLTTQEALTGSVSRVYFGPGVWKH